MPMAASPLRSATAKRVQRKGRDDHALYLPPVACYHVNFLHDVHEHLVDVVLGVRWLRVESADHGADRVVGREPEMDTCYEQGDHSRKYPKARRSIPGEREKYCRKKSGEDKIDEHEEQKEQPDAPALLFLYVDEGKGHGRRSVVRSQERTSNIILTSEFFAPSYCFFLLPQAQIHSRYRAVRFFGPEIFLWLEIEHRGNDVVRKYLDLRAIVRDQVVVKLTGEGDPVLC